MSPVKGMAAGGGFNFIRLSVTAPLASYILGMMVENPLSSVAKKESSDAKEEQKPEEESPIVCCMCCYIIWSLVFGCIR